MQGTARGEVIQIPHQRYLPTLGTLAQGPSNCKVPIAGDHPYHSGWVDLRLKLHRRVAEDESGCRLIRIGKNVTDSVTSKVGSLRTLRLRVYGFRHHESQ